MENNVTGDGKAQEPMPFESGEAAEDIQEYEKKINSILGEIEEMKEKYDSWLKDIERKLSEYESYFERIEKYENNFKTIETILSAMQETISNIQELLKNQNSEQQHQAPSDLQRILEPSEESFSDTFSSKTPSETTISEAPSEEVANAEKYIKKFSEYVDSSAAEILSQVENIKKRAMRNRVLLEILKDYEKLNFDSSAIENKLERELESYNEIPSYGLEDIKERIKEQIGSEELKKYDETKLREKIENAKTRVIEKIVKEEIGDKLPEIDYKEIVEIFVDYLEKTNKKKRSELYRDFDLLPETRLLGFILNAYTSVKENSKNGKVDADIVAEKVKSWYRISNPSNFKEELRKDIQPAAEYLILLLQTGRKEIEEHWNDIKRISDVYGIDVYPLVSPYYSKQKTFFDTALSYRSEKIWGNKRISAPLLF